MVLGMAPHVLVSSLNPQSEMHALVLITIPYLSFYSVLSVVCHTQDSLLYIRKILQFLWCIVCYLLG